MTVCNICPQSNLADENLSVGSWQYRFRHGLGLPASRGIARRSLEANLHLRHMIHAAVFVFESPRQQFSPVAQTVNKLV